MPSVRRAGRDSRDSWKAIGRRPLEGLLLTRKEEKKGVCSMQRYSQEGNHPSFKGKKGEGIRKKRKQTGEGKREISGGREGELLSRLNSDAKRENGLFDRGKRTVFRERAESSINYVLEEGVFRKKKKKTPNLKHKKKKLPPPKTTHLSPQKPNANSTSRKKLKKSIRIRHFL